MMIKKMMRKKFAWTYAMALATVLTTLSLTGCELNSNQRQLKGSGKIARETRPVGPFDAVANSTPFDLVVTAQSTGSVEVVGDDNLLAEVETLVEGNTLIVRQKNQNNMHFSWHRTPVTVNISAAALRQVSNSGSGDIRLRQLDSAQFTIKSSGSGAIEASGKVSGLRVQSEGSGDLDLAQLHSGAVALALNGSGNVRCGHISQALDAKLSGSGDFSADDLQAERVSLSILGSGNASVNGVIGSLQAELSGSGDLDASGLQVVNAEIDSKGSGNISLRSLSGNMRAGMAGSGDLSVDLKQAGQLELNSDGPGSSSLSGSAKTLTAKLGGSGDLDATALILEHASVKVTGPGEAEVNVKTTAGSNAANASRVVKIDRRGVVQ